MLENKIKLRPLFPNALTFIALGFGVSSLNMAFWGYWQACIAFLALSAFFDFADGKVARLLGVESKFGAELDSLSDFVSFGVAPGFIMYQWTMNPAMRISALSGDSLRAEAIGLPWGFVLFLAMCCAMRLARFNTMLDTKKPSYWNHFFMGVPAPAGAGIALFPLFLWIATGMQYDFMRSPAFVAFFLVFSGIMMASRIPTFRLKHLHVPEWLVLPLRLSALFVLACVYAFPWKVLSIVGICYFISIPISVYLFLRLRQKSEGRQK